VPIQTIVTDGHKDYFLLWNIWSVFFKGESHREISVVNQIKVLSI